MADLKPCPFCGCCEIELKCIDREMFIYALVCQNDECGCQGTKFQICRCDGLFEILKKVRAAASDRWNNRPKINEEKILQHTTYALQNAKDKERFPTLDKALRNA